MNPVVVLSESARSKQTRRQHDVRRPILDVESKSRGVVVITRVSFSVVTATGPRKNEEGKPQLEQRYIIFCPCTSS